jgi:hypothetical protein
LISAEQSQCATSEDLSSLKAGALYFVVVFAAGWVFGPIRQSVIIPRLGETIGLLLEAPLMLLVMFFAARWTIRRLAVASALETRAATGLVALGLLIVTELAGARWLRGLSLRDYLWYFASVPGTISLLLFFLFAAMPVLVERHPRR